MSRDLDDKRDILRPPAASLPPAHNHCPALEWLWPGPGPALVSLLPCLGCCGLGSGFMTWPCPYSHILGVPDIFLLSLMPKGDSQLLDQ